jgi:hypothetical protein
MNNQSWMSKHAVLGLMALEFDESIRLYSKDHWLMKLCGWFLFLVSFGFYKREFFATEFATTVGNFHFYPKEWSVEEVEISLAHEAEHTKQFRKFGLGIHPMVGLVPGFLIYVLFPLPIFFCYGRFWMEKNADAAMWKYALKNLNWTPNEVLSDSLLEAEYLSSLSYLWAYPRTLALKEYKKVAEQVIKGEK